MASFNITNGLALDSASGDGFSSEVTQPISMDGNNGIQVQVLLYALTATNVSIQVQVTNDMINWDNKGTAQTMTAIGRKVLTTETAIGASYVRVKFTITGSGKAILNAMINTSAQ